MKKIIAVLLVLMLGVSILSGCGGSLSGKYSLSEVEEEGEAQNYEDLVNEDKALKEEASEEYDESQYESYIEFLKDGKYKMVMYGGEPMEGTFEVSGKTVTLNPPEGYEDEESTEGTIDGNKIIFTPDGANGSKLTFVKK